jgi:SHS2 domain-containing protein
MKFKYLPDVATADIAFMAEGKTMDELFVNSALATSNTIMDLKSVKPKIAKQITVEEQDIERLLFAFLSEIIYFKDAELLFFSEFQIKVTGNKLSAVMKGDKYSKKMIFKNDVKAVTMHMLKIEKKDKFYSTVVLDI